MSTAKKKIKSPKTKTVPTPAPVETPEKGTPTDPAKVPADTDTEKKPGRPKGAKNRPKAADVPRKRRKQPEDIKDTGKALKALASDYNTLAEKHNRDHGTFVSKISEKPLDNQGPKKLAAPSLPAEAAQAVLSTGCEVLGQIWDVENRPSEEALKSAGESWAELSRYFVDINPIYIAAGAAVGSTVGCVLPMYLEKRAKDAKEKGETLQVGTP